MLGRKFVGIIALLVLLVLSAPAMAAKITEFNGESADVVDQTNYLVLGKGLSGNVTIQFDGNGAGYTLDSTNTTLIIAYAVNISSYSYTANGDTDNLSVTRNPLNLTFAYSGSSTANITAVNLVFNYSTTENASTGINTNTAMSNKAVLAYVANASNTTYNTTTTPEKVDYIVFNPATVYNYIGAVYSVDYNASATIGDEIDINLTTATTNKVVFDYLLYRYNYSNTLVPVFKTYFSVFLNDTYFTNVIPIAGANATDVGLRESDGYTEALFLDTNPVQNSTFQILAFAWDTNGTLEDGYKFKYNIDPIGGLPVTSEHTKNVTVTLPAAMIAPPTAMYWWEYEFYGINALVWIGIIVTTIIVAVLAYRYAKGKPLIPRSTSGLGSIVLTFALLTIWAQLTEWANEAYTWIQENALFIGIVMAVALIVAVASVIHFGTTRK